MKLQYSLAFLMVAVTAVCVGLGCSLYILAALRTLSLSANEWWGIALLSSVGFVLVLGVILYRR